VSTKAEIAIVLGLGSGVSDSLSSRITSLSIYGSGDGLTCNNNIRVGAYISSTLVIAYTIIQSGLFWSEIATICIKSRCFEILGYFQNTSLLKFQFDINKYSKN
jgi:hypothetical protein